MAGSAKSAAAAIAAKLVRTPRCLVMGMRMSLLSAGAIATTPCSQNTPIIRVDDKATSRAVMSSLRRRHERTTARSPGPSIAARAPLRDPSGPPRPSAELSPREGTPSGEISQPKCVSGRSKRTGAATATGDQRATWEVAPPAIPAAPYPRRTPHRVSEYAHRGRAASAPPTPLPPYRPCRTNSDHGRRWSHTRPANRN